MSSNQQELRPQRAEELSREILLSNLRAVADAGSKPHSLAELGAFALDAKVNETFSQAIERLGFMDGHWLGKKIEKGKRHGAVHVVAQYLHLPLVEGTSLHVYATDNELPYFGLLLPFDYFGRLDSARPITASSFITGDKVFAFLPHVWMNDENHQDPFFKQPLGPEQAAEAAENIAAVTEMAAATLFGLLEIDFNPNFGSKADNTA